MYNFSLRGFFGVTLLFVLCKYFGCSGLCLFLVLEPRWEVAFFAHLFLVYWADRVSGQESTQEAWMFFGKRC